MGFLKTPHPPDSIISERRWAGHFTFTERPWVGLESSLRTAGSSTEQGTPSATSTPSSSSSLRDDEASSDDVSSSTSGVDTTRSSKSPSTSPSASLAHPTKLPSSTAERSTDSSAALPSSSTVNLSRLESHSAWTTTSPSSAYKPVSSAIGAGHTNSGHLSGSATAAIVLSSLLAMCVCGVLVLLRYRHLKKRRAGVSDLDFSSLHSSYHQDVVMADLACRPPAGNAGYPVKDPMESQWWPGPGTAVAQTRSYTRASRRAREMRAGDPTIAELPGDGSYFNPAADVVDTRAGGSRAESVSPLSWTGGTLAAIGEGRR